MTKLNFYINTRVQVNETIRIVADCLATVRIHGREREKRGMQCIGTFVIACKFIKKNKYSDFSLISLRI